MPISFVTIIIDRVKELLQNEHLRRRNDKSFPFEIYDNSEKAQLTLSGRNIEKYKLLIVIDIEFILKDDSFKSAVGASEKELYDIGI